MAAILRISVPLQPTMGLRRRLVSLLSAFAVYTPSQHTYCHIKCEQMTLPGRVFENTVNHVQEITLLKSSLSQAKYGFEVKCVEILLGV